MAQLSHRTGSFNSIFGSPSNTRANDYKKSDNPIIARRISSSSNHKIQSQSSLVVRPVTPLIHQASEAHIHRIRYATSRGDLKRNLQLISASERTVQKSQDAKEKPESDNEDVESVDWTAPLDITAYLYKPEYIIRPSSKDSKENIVSVSSVTEQKNNLPVDETVVSSSHSTLNLSIISDEDANPTPSKEDFVDSYVRKSMRRDRDFKISRDMSDYTAFIKELNDELREVSQETKRLEAQSPRSRTIKQEARDEIIHRGYVTLRRIYELNPELTESAAKKNICGPPGNHWMGLSRVEVLEILHRIRTELGVPTDKYDDYGPKMNFLRRNDKKSHKGTRKSKKHAKKSSAVKEKKKVAARLKTPQVPFQHVPGPKHLHTNICIRPWEDTLDGWSHTKDEETEPSPSARSPRAEFDNPPNSPRKSTRSTPQNSLSDEPASPPNDNTNEEDFLTLEIFNPIFKVYR